MTQAPYREITRLLVANRGEIARRIMSTASAMGIATVAVYSDPDAESLHVEEADLAVRLPGALPAETYLRSDLLLDAARRAGADAVHPGYGFLSESAEFARSVEAAGLIWVGPPAGAIEAMGSKIGAKELMRAAGVPTLPSITVDDEAPIDDDQLKALGWPLLVKASAGGGGRGMRIVDTADELVDAVDAARREATAAFGDGAVFLERYLESPRHIEVQVVADSFGDTVALFERECSIQRRHQKIVEEAPAPTITPQLRARLTEAAVAAAKAVGYVNAGTVEFVVGTGGDDGDPYFLEMNTRLQVEHPVTEAVTGLDLVRLQLSVAAGRPLPDEVHRAVEHGPRGHSVEVRLYAEDPAQGWMPSTGTLHRFEVGAGRTPVRVDTAVRTGSVVSPYYDPMLAKVVSHAPTRAEATALLAAALAGARLHGIHTNRDLLVRTLRHPSFAAGETDTGFLDRVGLEVLAAPLADEDAVRRHAVAAALAGQAVRRGDARVQPTVPSGFRNNRSALQEITFEGPHGSITVGYAFDRQGRRLAVLEIDGARSDLEAVRVTSDQVDLAEEGGLVRSYLVDVVGPTVYVDGPDGGSVLVERDRLPAGSGQAMVGSALAPMPGGVVRIAVAEGEEIEAGQLLVVLEAMKMEHAVHAAAAGTVTSVGIAVGDQVETGQVLVVVDAHQDGKAP